MHFGENQLSRSLIGLSPLPTAILERVRNSSLVEWFRADNVVGLKHTAEAAANIFVWVGERRVWGEAVPEGAVDCMRVRMQA